jgi:hypothetical protein
VNATLHHDVYLLEFIMDCEKVWNNLEIKADYFMELFPTQSNIIQIEYKNEKRFHRLLKDESVFKTKFL